MRATTALAEVGTWRVHGARAGRACAAALLASSLTANEARASEPADRTRGAPAVPPEGPQAPSGSAGTPDPAPDPALDGGTATERPRPNGLMIGGYVTAGLAAAALGPLVAGVVMAKRATDDYPGDRTPAEVADDDQRRVDGHRLAAAGGIAAGALGISAIVLVAVGKHRRSSEGVASVRVAPQIDPSAGAGGVLLTGRF